MFELPPPATGDVRNRANPNFDYASVQQYTIEIEAVWLGPPDLVSAPGNLTVDIERVNKPPYHEAWAKVFHTSIMELEVGDKANRRRHARFGLWRGYFMVLLCLTFHGYRNFRKCGSYNVIGCLQYWL